MRNFEKTIANVKINERYDLTIPEEVEILKKLGTDDIGDLIYNVFKYGYALGSRAEKSKAKKSA